MPADRRGKGMVRLLHVLAMQLEHVSDRSFQ